VKNIYSVETRNRIISLRELQQLRDNRLVAAGNATLKSIPGGYGGKTVGARVVCLFSEHMNPVTGEWTK
jgi:hypothetical protein